MTTRPAGQLLDSLGVTLDLDDDDLIPTAVVIAKVIQADGSVSVCISDSDTCTWLDQLALVTAADDILSGGWCRTDED